jgi:hypothetical protein
MKKTTVIIVLVAAALAAFVYFYDLKHNKPSSSSGDTDADTSGSGEDTTKPAFTFTPSDVATMTIERAGTAVALEKRADAYYMTQPYATRADQSGVGAIAGELASVRVSRTITATPEQLATFGLTKPEVEIDFSLKNGTKHKLKLGAKDFSGTSVYALVDDAKDVSILPDTILTSSNKPADDFRDQSVLSFQTSDATSFDLKNESGEIAASKHDSSWKIEKPRTAAADGTAVSSFLDTLATGQVASFVEDTSPNSAKYGLSKPAVTFRVELGGGKSVELEVGNKDGGSYYARQTSQPFIFRIKETLYKTLGQKLFDFRDKQLVHVSEDDVVRVDIQDAGATEACVKDSNGEWSASQPAGAKAKPTNCPSLWGSLRDARATNVIDSPSGTVNTQLAKPAIEVTLTDKAGKKTEVRISAASGKSVYARTGNSPEVFQLDKQILSDLNPANNSVHD